MFQQTRRVTLALVLVVCFLLSGCGPEYADNYKETLNTSQSQIITETFESKALGREMKTAVYLPNGYDDSLEYPVIYLFHGHGGLYTQWLYDFNGMYALDELIEMGEMPPTIVICPQVDSSYGMNTGKENKRLFSEDGKLFIDLGPYEDYLFNDMMPYIESKYAISKEPSNRSIGGFSMGGHMALRLGFAHPELFSRIGAHSAPIKTEKVNFGGIIKEALYPTESLRKERDPYLMADYVTLPNTTVYIDIGDRDSSYSIEGNEALYEKLKARNIKSEFHLSPGGHNSEYVSGQIVNYLRFYGGK